MTGRCNVALRVQGGLPIPRTCARCGLGPCAYLPTPPDSIGPTAVLKQDRAEPNDPIAETLRRWARMSEEERAEHLRQQRESLAAAYVREIAEYRKAVTAAKPRYVMVRQERLDELLETEARMKGLEK